MSLTIEVMISEQQVLLPIVGCDGCYRLAFILTPFRQLQGDAMLTREVTNAVVGHFANHVNCFTNRIGGDSDGGDA